MSKGLNALVLALHYQPKSGDLRARHPALVLNISSIS